MCCSLDSFSQQHVLTLVRSRPRLDEKVLLQNTCCQVGHLRQESMLPPAEAAAGANKSTPPHCRNRDGLICTCLKTPWAHLCQCQPAVSQLLFFAPFVSCMRALGFFFSQVDVNLGQVLNKTHKHNLRKKKI